jgi:hypothetical protein
VTVKSRLVFDSVFPQLSLQPDATVAATAVNEDPYTASFLLPVPGKTTIDREPVFPGITAGCPPPEFSPLI